MTLFVSNPSGQHVLFLYRDPRNNLLARIDLQSGHQAEIGKAWSAAETALVVEQLERFGARDAAESHGTMGRFTGLLYRDMAPVTTDEIEMAHAALVGTLEERSAAEATRSALAFDRAVNGGTRGQRRARTTQVEVLEQLEPNARPTGREIAFGLTVDPEGSRDMKLPA